MTTPGVATTFDFGTQDGCEFLVMEYVAGGTLEVAMEEHSPGLILLRVHPRLDAIRNDPRCRRMVEKVELG